MDQTRCTDRCLAVFIHIQEPQKGGETITEPTTSFTGPPFSPWTHHSHSTFVDGIFRTQQLQRG